MKTIEIDDDLYLHIARHTMEIGESASNILRRLLGISASPMSDAPNQQPAASLKAATVSASIAKPLTASNGHELSAALGHPEFQRMGAAVDRMLYLLAKAHDQKRSEFEKVLVIQGRERRYFAKSEKEIEDSGTSTQPRKIPGTDYWVMTNSPTPQKQDMLRDALGVLGYSPNAIRESVAAIR